MNLNKIEEGMIVWSKMPNNEIRDINIMYSHRFRPYLIFMIDGKNIYAFPLSSKIIENPHSKTFISKETYNLKSDGQANLNELHKLNIADIHRFVDYISESDMKLLLRKIYVLRDKRRWDKQGLDLYKKKYRKEPKISQGTVVKDSYGRLFVVHDITPSNYFCIPISLKKDEYLYEIKTNGHHFSVDLNKIIKIGKNEMTTYFTDVDTITYYQLKVEIKRRKEETKTHKDVIKNTDIIHEGMIVVYKEMEFVVVAVTDTNIYALNRQLYLVATDFTVFNINEITVIGLASDKELLKIYSYILDKLSFNKGRTDKKLAMHIKIIYSKKKYKN